MQNTYTQYSKDQFVTWLTDSLQAKYTRPTRGFHESLARGYLCRISDSERMTLQGALKSFSGLQYDAQRELDYEAVKDNPEYESYIRAAVDAGMSAAILEFEDWQAVKDNPDFIVPYRCANTPDMFKTKGV